MTLFIRQRFIAGATWVLLGGATGVAAGAPTSGDQPTMAHLGHLSPSERDHLEAIVRDREAAALHDASRRPVDADHYDLALDIDLDTESIAGVMTLTATSRRPGLAGLDLDLDDALAVTGVTVNGAPAPFTHADDRLAVTIDPPADPGDQISIEVAYGGQPVPQGFGSFLFEDHGGVPIVQSFSQPYFARTWWPCLDHPDDKATATLHVTVPDWMVVGSNGVLTGVDHPGGGRATYHWEESHPISTYLVSIVATNYVIIEDTYVSGGQSMPIMHHVFPEDSLAAATDFDITVPLLELYASRFGEYPFIDEKFGVAEFRHAGAMEHQTLISYSSGFVQGNHFNDQLLAHEMAHQWWGDCVTLRDYRHMWLNEGFATYSESLWLESIGGEAAYRQFFADRDHIPFPGTLYDPISIFSFVSYLKGAWVLHMLRGMYGDDLFFPALQSYLRRHAYGNATSWSFRDAVEEVVAEDLDWFFAQWVFDEGRPAYEWSWTTDAAETVGPRVLGVDIRQLQDGRVFRMPLTVRAYTGGTSTDFRVWNDARRQSYRLLLDAGAPVDSVVVDPDGWVLKWVGPPPAGTLVDIGHGDGFGVGDADGDDVLVDATGSGALVAPLRVWASPNPFRALTCFRMTPELPAGASFRLEIFDAGGRLCYTREGTGSGNGVPWAGNTLSERPLPAGVYHYRVMSANRTVTGTLTRLP